MKITFRVDASLKIGSGHVMRCLTLARELVKRGSGVEFICRELAGNLISYIESQGFKVRRLPASSGVNAKYCFHADWLEESWEVDAEQSLPHAKGADWLVVDHYALDAKWEGVLRGAAGKIMVVDDLADREHVCDLLLDQNYYLNAEKRYNGLLPTKCVQLLSPRYALLREEFLYARAALKREYHSIKKIFISFGGVDVNNDTGKALEAIREFTGEVVIIAGGANAHFAGLGEFCAGRTNFNLLRNSDNIAQLMAESDLAIGGGGGTSWERAALGLPTIGWPIAENQVHILLDLSRAGVVKLSSPEKLVGDITGMTVEELRSMSEKGMELCDAEGAVRVANKIWSL